MPSSRSLITYIHIQSPFMCHFPGRAVFVPILWVTLSKQIRTAELTQQQKQNFTQHCQHQSQSH